MVTRKGPCYSAPAFAVGRGVTAARQVLALLVEVRILAPQLRRIDPDVRTEPKIEEERRAR